MLQAREKKLITNNSSTNGLFGRLVKLYSQANRLMTIQFPRQKTFFCGSRTRMIVSEWSVGNCANARGRSLNWLSSFHLRVLLYSLLLLLRSLSVRLQSFPQLREAGHGPAQRVSSERAPPKKHDSRIEWFIFLILGSGLLDLTT